MKDASGHEHDEKGLFTGPGALDTQAQAKEKLKLMMKSAAVSIDKGGRPTKDDVVFEYNHKMYYVGRDSEHMVKDFAARGLVKRVRGYHNVGGPGAPKQPSNIKDGDMIPHPALRNSIIYGEAVALNWQTDGAGASRPRRVQLSPIGDFPLRDGSARAGTVQRCTKANFDALVANWRAAGSPDILVDVDHASATGGSTEAAAWCNALESTDEGLFGVFTLTPRGQELVNGRAYRFVSPGWTLSPDGAPLALCSVGLTNRPNLPVKPVVNSGDAGGRDPDDPNNETKGHPEMDLTEIAAALGLPETASKEEILAAIKAKDDAIAQAAAEKANARAEEFAENAVKGGKIAANAKEAVKAAYLKSPEVAEEMLNSLAPAAPEKPAQTVLNARTGVTPGTVSPLREGLAKCKNAAARVEYINAHAAEFAAEGK